MRGQSSSLSKLSEPQLMQPLKESTPKNNYYLSYNPSKHHANRSVGPYPESNNGSYTAAHNSHEVKHHYSISGSNNANENPRPAQKSTNQYYHRRNNSEPHPFIPNNQPADYGQRHHQYESTRDGKSKHSVEKLRDHSDSQLKTLLSPTNDKTSSKSPLYKKEANYSSAQITAKQPRIHIDLSSILKPQVGNHIVRDARAYKTSSQTSMLAAPASEEIDKENRSVKANVTLFGNQRFPLNLKYGLPNPSAPQTNKNEEAPSIYSAYINMGARREPVNHQAEAQNYSLYNLSGGTTTPVPPSARRTEGKPNVDHGVIKPPNRNTATDYTRGGHRRTASTSQIGDYPTSFYLNVSQRQEKSPEKANMSTSLCNFDDNIDPNQHNKFTEIAVNYPASSFLPSTPSSNLLYNPKDLQPPSLPTPKEMNKDKMSMNNILNKMTTSSSTRNRDLPRQIQPQNNQSSSRLGAPQSVQIQLEERQLDRRRNPEHDSRKEQRNARHASAIYEGQQNYSYKIEVDNSKSESMQAERKLMKMLNPESTRNVGVSESNSSLNTKHKRTKSMTEKLKSQSRILSKKKSFAEDFQKSIAEKDRSLGTEEGYGTDHSSNSVEKDDGHGQGQGQQQIREIKQIIHNQIEIKDAIDKERPCRIGSNLQETRIRGYPVDSLPLQQNQGQTFVRTRPVDDLRNDVNNSLKYHVKGDFSSRNNASIVRGKPVYINNSQNNIEEEKVESIIAGGGLSRGISTGTLHKGHNETKQAYKSQLRRNASQPEELRMFSNNQNSQDKIRTNLSVNYRDVDIKDKYSSERRNNETPGIDILKGMLRPTENSRGSITLKERHENVVTTANSSKIQGTGGITTERDGKENGEKGFWFGDRDREKNNSSSSGLGTAVTKKTDRSSMNSLTTNVEKAKLSTTWDSHDHVFQSSNQYYIHRDAEKSRRTTQLNQSGTTQTTKRDTSKDGSSYIGGRAERHIIEEEIEIEKKENKMPEKIDIFKLHEQQKQQKMMIPEIAVMGNTSNFLTENNTSLVDVGHREGTLIDRNPLLSSTELSSKDVFSGRKVVAPTLNNYTTPISQVHIAATNPVTAVTTPKVTNAPVNSARKPIEEKPQQPRNKPASIQSNYEKEYEMFKNTFSQRQTPISTPQNQNKENHKYSSTQVRSQAPQRNQKEEAMVKNRLKDVLENRPLQISSTSNKSGSTSTGSKPHQTLQKSSSMRQYERSVEPENLEKQSQSGYSSKTDQIARHMRSKDAQLVGTGGRTSKETSVEYGSIQQQQMSKNEETPMTTMRPQKEGLLSVRAMLEDLSNRKNSIKTPFSELVSPQVSTKNATMKEMFRSEYRKNDLKQQSRDDHWEGQKKDPLEEIDYLSSICSIDDEPAEATMISDQIVDTVRILQGKKQEQMMKQKQAEIKEQHREAYSSAKVIRKTQEIRAEENPKCDQETKRRTRDHKSGGSIRDFEYLNNNKFDVTNWSKKADFDERNSHSKGNLEILTFEKSDFNLLATNRNKCDTSRSKRSSANHERNLENPSNIYQVYQTMSQKTSPMVRRSPIGFSRSSNKQLVKNALNNVCLAGEVNRKEREEVLAKMDEVKDRTNFIIVFKETSGRQDFKALYYYDSAANLATKIYSNGTSPHVLDESMIANYYRYDSGSREFKNIADNKSLSIIVDAVGLNSFVTRRF